VQLANEYAGVGSAAQDQINEWTRLLNRRDFCFRLRIIARADQFQDRGTVCEVWTTSADDRQKTASSVVSGLIMLFISLYTLYYFYREWRSFSGLVDEGDPLTRNTRGN